MAASVNGSEGLKNRNRSIGRRPGGPDRWSVGRFRDEDRRVGHVAMRTLWVDHAMMTTNRYKHCFLVRASDASNVSDASSVSPLSKTVNVTSLKNIISHLKHFFIVRGGAAKRLANRRLVLWRCTGNGWREGPSCAIEPSTANHTATRVPRTVAIRSNDELHVPNIKKVMLHSGELLKILCDIIVRIFGYPFQHSFFIRFLCY